MLNASKKDAVKYVEPKKEDTHDPVVPVARFQG